jgi:hypothetical protein
MKTTATRSIAADERTRLEEFLAPVPRRNPGRFLGLVMAVPVGFTVLVIAHGLLPGAGLASLFLAVAATGGAAWLFGRWAIDRHAAALQPPPQVEELIRKDLSDGRVHVTRYEAEAAVRVAADPRRLVAATWFLKLADGSVVLLVGPHFGEAEEAGQFPATAFEVASGESSAFVLSVRRLGERLPPVKTRAPLSDAEWEEIGEDDDEKVPLTWPEVLAAAERNPVREEEGEGKPGRQGPSAGTGPVVRPDAPTDIPAGPIRPK